MRALALGMLLAAGSAAAAPAAADGVELLRNGDFAAAGADGAAEGWERRTKEGCAVGVREEEGKRFARLEVTTPGQSAILQQWAEWPAGTVRLECAARYRWAGIVPGAKSHMRGKVQGRWRIDGREGGDWIELGTLEGTATGWVERTTGAVVPTNATAAYLRLALYNVAAGRLDVARASVRALSAEDWAARVAERERLAAAERAKYRPAEEFGEPVSDARFARLARGVNINNWLAQPYNARMGGEKGGFTDGWIRGFVTEAELRGLAALGMGHVRLPVEPQAFMDLATGEVKPELLPALDEALRRIVGAGLAVVVDAHPKMPALKGLSGKADLRERYVAWWGRFAAHLAATDPERVFLEPLNEPGGQAFWANPAWWDYQDRLFTAVRAAAPRHTIVGNAGAYQLVHELERFAPHTDRNAVYAVHYYEPSQFTHQGAIWMKDWYHPLRRVPWPLAEAGLAQAIASLDRRGANAAKAPAAEKALRGAVAEGVGTRERIAQNLDKVAAWSKSRARRVVIGEMGVLKTHAADADRCAWLSAVRTAAEERGIGWTMWEYAAEFGFMGGTNEPGKRVLDAAAARALGLNAPPP